LGLTYVTTPDVIKEDPERIERFMRAALRGIEYAKEHPDEAIEYVLKYTGPEADAAHQKYMLETELRDAYSDLTDQYGLGWQTAEQWQALADSLLKYNALAQPVDVNVVFDNQFLAKIYGK
jgi:ABC-type nitrate/sulfonate/bicarbonate transport system substrate-binding protein